MTALGWDGWFVLAVVGGVLAALIGFGAPADAVLLGAVIVLLAAGILTPEQAFGGFANSGMLTVAALFVVAAGLKETGAVQRLAATLLGRPKSLTAALTRLVIPTAAASAFLNNTPIVAALMPAIADWSRRSGVSASKLLMPLSFAAIVGGTVTLFGTSTNLVVHGLLLEQVRAGRTDVHGLSLFEISPIGLPVAIMGCLWLIVGANTRLLPERVPAIRPTDDARQYTVELRLQPDSPLVGRTIEEAGLRHLPGAFLVELDRRGNALPAVGPDERLEADDRLVFAGVVESVVDLTRLPGLVTEADRGRRPDADGARCLVEAVVSPSNPYRGQTIRDARFRTHYGAAILAVARHGQRVEGRIGDIVLRPGDVLLLATHRDFVQHQRDRNDFYLVSEVADSAPLRHERGPLALAILGVMILVAGLEWMDMLRAAFLAAAVMVLTGCVSFGEARRSVDATVLVAIAAAFGLARAMQATGVDRFLAAGIATAGDGGPRLALVAFYVSASIITELMTNNAAAALLFPLALAVADALGVNPMPFVIALMFGASASLLTPIGYQTNLMVWGPGGYRFTDFARLGLPLSIVIGVTTVILVPLLFPF